jgi:hypothetical protein
VTSFRRISRAGGKVRSGSEAYAGGAERPLRSFAVIMGAYGVLVASMGAYLVRSGRPVPERPAWSDLGLLAVATHKLSRQLAKDPVTSPLRAPFTRYSGTSGEAEVAEEVRGHGPRHAVGELVSCPFCRGQWVATAGVFGLIAAPRPTRAIAGVFAELAGADFLQFACARLQDG